MDDTLSERRAADAAHLLAIEELVGDPRFPTARSLYLDRFLALYGNDPFLARLLIESGRFFVHKILILLDAAQDPDRRDTWLTIGRLKKEMTVFGFASSRQVDHLVARLAAVGFLERLPAGQDRRVKLLKPTEKMLAHDRDWLAAHFAPLTILRPHNDYGPVMRGDAAFLMELRRRSVQYLPLAAELMAMTPDMLMFFAAAAGHMVLAALLHAALSEPDRLHAPLPYAAAGDRFGVSRTHVRQLLEKAQAAELVKLHGRGGHLVEILPRLWASYDRSIAVGMYLHDMVHAIAMGRQSPPVV